MKMPTTKIPVWSTDESGVKYPLCPDCGDLLARGFTNYHCETCERNEQQLVDPRLRELGELVQEVVDLRQLMETVNRQTEEIERLKMRLAAIELPDNNASETEE